MVLKQDLMTWKDTNSIETCILSYVKWITSSGSMCETGCLGLVHWDDPEGRDGEGDGRGVQDGEHMYPCGRFMSMYGKTMKILLSNYPPIKIGSYFLKSHLGGPWEGGIIVGRKWLEEKYLLILINGICFGFPHVECKVEEDFSSFWGWKSYFPPRIFN